MAKQLTLEAQQELVGQIVVRMNEQSASMEAILKRANTILSGIDKKDKNYQRLNDSLQTITTTTKAAIKSFNADKKLIQTKLIEANKFYNEKYLPVAKKINDPSKGLPAILKATEKDFEAYTANKEKCIARFQEITDIAKDCKAKSRELAGIERAIVKLHNKAEGDTTKTNELLTAAKQTQVEISQIHKDLVGLHNKSDTATQNIEALEDKSRILNTEIIEYHRVSEERRKDIEKIYGIAHETGLSGEFEKRRNSLAGEIGRWKWWIFGTSLLLLLGVIAFYILQLRLHNWDVEDAFDLNFYIRFLIFSPLVYYLYFVSTQYNKAQKLHDKYAFKTTLAMVIKSHIELLTQHGYFEKDGQIDRILDFVLSGFGKIYNEPYTEDSYKMKIKLANFEIDMQKKIIEKLREITGYEHDGGNVIQAVMENK